MSLVLCAGHGIEINDVNYLVPVNARLERDVDVRFEAVTVDDLLVSISAAGALDAAHGGDPYGQPRQLRRHERGPAGGRDVGGVSGGGRAGDGTARMRWSRSTDAPVSL
ncbi:MAG: hypothetical protein OXG44_08075 [Gammaproteobacteria bacterium]|nr:hypothetical protein [Gammaproteobacteria bacterium]